MKSRPTLTGLVGGNGDSGTLLECGALLRDAVQGLDLEGIGGVSQQVGHGHCGVGEADTAW